MNERIETVIIAQRKWMCDVYLQSVCKAMMVLLNAAAVLAAAAAVAFMRVSFCSFSLSLSSYYSTCLTPVGSFHFSFVTRLRQPAMRTAEKCSLQFGDIDY